REAADRLVRHRAEPGRLAVARHRAEPGADHEADVDLAAPFAATFFIASFALRVPFLVAAALPGRLLLAAAGAAARGLVLVAAGAALAAFGRSGTAPFFVRRPRAPLVRAAALVAAARLGPQHRLLEGVLKLGRDQRLGDLDVGLDLQRLLEVLDPGGALLEPADQQDADVDLGARRDGVLLQPGRVARVQRLLQEIARAVIVLFLVGRDRLLVEVGDLVQNLGARLGGARHRGRKDES